MATFVVAAEDAQRRFTMAKLIHFAIASLDG
jgi:hypothetical protein